MSMHVKRWYRSRRNQILLFAIISFSLIYYQFLHERPTIEENLNLTRSLRVCEYDPGQCTIVYVRIPKFIQPKYDLYIKIRASIIQYIEERLQEALREDKGQGCEMPILDPFSKEVTQFDKEYPPVDCDGLDWVKCYLSECHVIEPILLTTSNIKCTYRDIIYINDDKYVLGPPTTVDGAGEYKLVNSDHVKITCTGLRFDNYLSSKWTGFSLGFRELKPKDPPKGRENTFNVLILGFDSTAKNGFIRRMPKSYKVLKDELKASILNGYNIVGDGTPAALLPILTGKTELELPESRKSISGSGHLDVMPFIFYKLRDDGYRTAYFEDMPWIGTFQYRFRGFQKQPADHYLRDFYLEESRNGWKWWNIKGSSRYCVGDTPQYRIMINITEQFFKLQGKKYCFTFIADITHDDFNMISTADDDLTTFLRAFKKDGRLDNTLLMVMGDHGPRYANVRDTFQGKLEERLPLMAIVLPKQLRDQRPSAQIALDSNIDALTTPHDIYATVLDVIDMKQHWNDYKIAGADLPRGMTLLEPIPRNRSCSEAGIEPHWCACVKWTKLDTDDPIYTKAANALVEHINNYTQFMRSRCAPRTLSSIEWVMKQDANKRLIAFKGARDSDGYVGKFDKKPVTVISQTYQVKIIVAPGKGVYEATMSYLTKEKLFRIDTRDIQRTNAYGSEPSCISEEFPRLNMFCYCYGYTASKSDDNYEICTSVPESTSWHYKTVLFKQYERLK